MIQEKTFSFSQTTRQHSLSVYHALALVLSYL